MPFDIKFTEATHHSATESKLLQTGPPGMAASHPCPAHHTGLGHPEVAEPAGGQSHEGKEEAQENDVGPLGGDGGGAGRLGAT